MLKITLNRNIQPDPQNLTNLLTLGYVSTTNGITEITQLNSILGTVSHKVII